MTARTAFTRPLPARLRRAVTRIGSVLTAAALLAAGSLGVAAPASAVPVYTADLSFSIDPANLAAGATVTGYTGSDTAISIPPEVVLDGVGHVVTTIGSDAFTGEGLTAVTFPDTITTIGGTAFAGNSLTELTLPDSVTDIGEFAFAENSLQSLHLGSSTVSIGMGAFLLNQLTSVSFPDSVTTIGYLAFAMNKLQTVTLGTGVQSLSIGSFGLNYDYDPAAPDGPASEYAVELSTLRSVVFTGPAPTTFVGANAEVLGDPFADLDSRTGVSELTVAPELAGALGRAAVSDLTASPFDSLDLAGDDAEIEFFPLASLGPGFDMLVSYPVAQGADRVGAGGYTAPRWMGYDTQAIAVVDFELNGHGTAIDAQSVVVGSRATEPAAPTDSAFAFTGWFTDAGLTAPFDFSSPITDDTTLHAQWVPITATVSFELNGHGAPIADQHVILGEKATQPDAPVAAGYTFTGWLTEADPQSPFDFATPITADTVLSASWVQDAVVPPVTPVTPTPPSTTSSPALASTGTAEPSGALLAGLAALLLGAALTGAGILTSRRRTRSVL